MTKADIVHALHDRLTGLTHREAAALVDAVFDLLKETLGRGEKVKVSSFGNLVPHDKRERPGRNPQTGEPIKIEARRVLTFKASVILKEALNRKAKQGEG
jgi:integration host factor subunit alpha